MNEYLSKWGAEDGDRTHRLNYDELTPDSLVLDVGGYRGDWASDIYAKYSCNIIIFEPVKMFYNWIVARFNKNDKIKVFNYGLSNITRKVLIYRSDDSTSIHKTEVIGVAEEIDLVGFSEMISENKIITIDLMKVNIEGEEYKLLSDIVDNEPITRMIKNIQVQFHDFIEDTGRGRPYIHSKLWNTHYLTYNFAFVWENWKVRDTEFKPLIKK